MHCAENVFEYSRHQHRQHIQRKTNWWSTSFFFSSCWRFGGKKGGRLCSCVWDSARICVFGIDDNLAKKREMLGKCTSSNTKIDWTMKDDLYCVRTFVYRCVPIEMKNIYYLYVYSIFTYGNVSKKEHIPHH